MEQTPNCKKCIHCYWDDQWKEWICNKDKYTISNLNELAICPAYKDRGEINAD